MKNVQKSNSSYAKFLAMLPCDLSLITIHIVIALSFDAIFPTVVFHKVV